MPLVQQIDRSQPVYVLDDGVMTSGRAFTFTSIDHVAQTCLPFVEAIAAAHESGSGEGSDVVITLGGWSYGGVVASAVAKLLNQQGSRIRVKALVLFDAPLRAPRKVHSSSDSEGVSSTAPAVVSPTDASSGSGGAAFDLQARTQAHFRSCTDLLQLFYGDQRNAPPTAERTSPPLQCNICDVRPEQTDYDCGLEAAAELTSGQAQRVTVPGTHWTMLFQDNVISVGKVLRDLL